MFLLIITLIPLGLGLLYSLLYSVGLAGIGNGFTLKYCQQILSDRHIYFSLFFSFYIAVLSIISIIMISLFLALTLNKKLSKGFFSYVIHVPLAIPAIVGGFLNFQLFSSSGWFSRILLATNLISSNTQFPEIVNDDFGIAIILTHVLLAIPFFTIYFLKLYEAENIESYKLIASTLGAKKNQIDFQVIIPMLLKSSFPILLLYLLFIFGSYEIPLILGSQSSEMISILTERKLQRFNLDDVPGGYVITIVYFLITSSIVYQSIQFKNKIEHA